MSESKFWMVLVKGTKSTHQSHYNKAKAVAEAKRLCRLNNETVFITEVVEYYTPPEQPEVILHTEFSDETD